jgi:non-specific serine/threonine protein kinase
LSASATEAHGGGGSAGGPAEPRLRELGPYRVVERVGGGGMGVVYKAIDSRLGRPVAIKLLTRRLIGNEVAKQRFLQEARAASAIDHPNICTIHDIEETADGELCLVMAYYEGQTLAERIATLGTIPTDQALDLQRQLLTGLARAHEAGIVHRDIKPGNLMITRHRELKILDFGLAKLAGALDLTQTGMVHGTAAYMSPEQARGQPADHRSDLWSAGVVLYEMLVGRPPFAGDNAPTILYSIVHEEPEPLSALRDDVPPELDDLLAVALAKEPERRYQTARSFLADLEGPPPSFSSPPTLAFAAPGRPAPVRSILVLPFANVSPDHELDYFSDGLTDEVITDLSGVDALRVISRRTCARSAASCRCSTSSRAPCASAATRCGSPPSWSTPAATSTCGPRSSTAGSTTCWRSRSSCRARSSTPSRSA